jgi:Uma2 family endonuclease
MSIQLENDWQSTPMVLGGGDFFANMSRDDFFAFCQRNHDKRLERTADGDLVIMTPSGGETGRRNSQLTGQMFVWCERDGTGVAFDSSTGFWLPNGAERSPDAAWILRERWEALSEKDRKKFPPLAPDFVIELRSETDRLNHQQAKMVEYMANGVRLGWLIDPIAQRVEVYRPGQAPQILEAPTQVSGDPELAGFVLDLTKIW